MGKLIGGMGCGGDRQLGGYVECGALERVDEIHVVPLGKKKKTKTTGEDMLAGALLWNEDRVGVWQSG